MEKVAMFTMETVMNPCYHVVWLVPVVIYVYISYSGRKNRARFESMHLVPYVSMPNILLAVLGRIDFEPLKLQAINKVGKVFGFNFLLTDTILVADPKLVQLVLSKEFTNFVNRRQFGVSDRIFQHVLAIVTDDKWKRLRSIITPTFATGKLRNMMPRLRITVDTLINNIDEMIAKETCVGHETTIDMKMIANSFTMDTIAQTAFGLQLDSLKDPNNQIVKFAQKLFAGNLTLANTFKFAIIFTSPRLANLLKLELNSDVNTFFSSLTSKILEEQRKLLQAKGDKFRASSFIELLLEAEAEYDKQLCGEGGGHKFMTHDEIVAQCAMFFLAGFESTASTISMTMHQLAMNERVQDKLYREIVQTLPTLETKQTIHENGNEDAINKVNLDNLSKLEYLTCVVNETLRLNAPALFTERQASKDITLQTDNHVVRVKKGDMLHIPIYAMHRDPQQFTDPQTFEPERFVHPVHHNYAFLPFGHGPRNCVAKHFALLETKLAVLHLVYRFKFSKCKHTKHPPDTVNQTNMVILNNVPLRVEKRL